MASGSPASRQASSDRISLALHGGVLKPIGEAALVDVKLALPMDVGDVSLQAGWQIKGNACVPGPRRARALTASISRRF